jgi:leukotriene-A4 hydrolase
MGNSIDSSTYANIEEVRTEALDLQLKVNFADKTFEGFAEHDLEILVNGTQIVYFDVVGMDISSIEQYGQKNTSYGVHWAL